MSIDAPKSCSGQYLTALSSCCLLNPENGILNFLAGVPRIVVSVINNLAIPLIALVGSLYHAANGFKYWSQDEGLSSKHFSCMRTDLARLLTLGVTAGIGFTFRPDIYKLEDEEQTCKKEFDMLEGPLKCLFSD